MNRSLIRAHPWTAGLLALSLVGVLVFGGAAGANAAIWPKGFNPKQYMLNVLSSMLSGASPDSKLGDVKRSVIQADQQFDHSWEALDELWKKDSSKVPNTYEDYALQKQQYFSDKGIKGIQGQLGTPDNTGKGTKYVKPMKAPATKASALIKKGVGVGVGVGASVGWAYRADIGSSVSALFGVDAQGAVCSSRDALGNLADAVNFITGQDCDAWQTAQDFDANADVTARPDGWKYYPLPWGCDNDADPSTCYQTYTVTPDVEKVNKQTITWHPGKNVSSFLVHTAYCQKDGKIGYGSVSPEQLSIPAGETSGTATVTCPDGAVLYALSIGSYDSGVDPDHPDGNQSRFWYSDASPNYTKGTSSDPDRTFLCTYTMADGTTTEKETDTFKETDDDVPSPVCPAVDPDSDNPVESVSVDEVNKDDGTKQNVYQQDTTDQYQEWWEKYPECREGACALDLIIKKSNTSCFYDNTTAEACVDWMKDPDKTENYQCMYGGHKVDLTECYAYGDVFNPEKVLAGQAYTDPATGESVDGQSSPNAAQKTLGRSFTDPQDFTGCLDTGWAQANPVEWVMTPVQCALQWAFAPSTQVVTTTTNQVQNQWASKAPGKIANAVSTWSITAPGGCDIPVDVMGTHLDLSPACPGQPLAGLATLSKIATTAMVAVIVFFACRRVVRSWIGDTDSADGGADR